MPLQRRLPKFGFKNINRVEYQPVNLSALQAYAEASGAATVTVADLVAAGVAKKNMRVKILGNGTLTAKLDVTAHAFSESAKAAIEAVGGTATKL